MFLDKKLMIKTEIKINTETKIKFKISA